MSHTAAAPIYDHAGSLARMGDDLQLFCEMATYLSDDGRRWLRDIKSALNDRDTGRVQQRAHSLKGLVSNFGMGRAWRAASNTEDLAKSQRLDELAASVANLDSALQELLLALTPYIKENPLDKSRP